MHEWHSSDDAGLDILDAPEEPVLRRRERIGRYVGMRLFAVLTAGAIGSSAVGVYALYENLPSISGSITQYFDKHGGRDPSPSPATSLQSSAIPAASATTTP